MAEQLVPPVEAAGVGPQKPLHAGDQIGLGRLCSVVTVPLLGGVRGGFRVPIHGIKVVGSRPLAPRGAHLIPPPDRGRSPSAACPSGALSRCVPPRGSLISFLRPGVVFIYSSGASVFHTILAPALRSCRRVPVCLWGVLVWAVQPLEQGTALSQAHFRKP